MISVKTVCKFQVIWMKNKKVLWILVQKLSILNKSDKKDRKSVMAHSLYIYGMRCKNGVQNRG